MNEFWLYERAVPGIAEPRRVDVDRCRIDTEGVGNGISERAKEACEDGEAMMLKWFEKWDKGYGYLGGDKGISEVVYGGQDSDLRDFNLLEVISSDDQLREALSYLPSYSRALVIGGPPKVFERRENWLDFVNYLKFVVLHVDHKIRQMEEMVERAGDSRYVVLQNNWRDTCRFAAYSAALLHFGAVRTKEASENGKPKYYCRHVIATAVNEAMGKCGVFEDKFLAACFLHDSSEDWHKGIAAVLSLGNEDLIYDQESGHLSEELKAVAAEKKRERKEDGNDLDGKFQVILQDVYAVLDQMIGLDGNEELLVGEIVDVVTKQSSDRYEAMLLMFDKVAQIARSRPALALEALCVILFVKFPDRLNNIKTFFGTPSSQDVHDETVYLMWTLAMQLGMKNVAGWFFTYLQLKDKSEMVKVLVDSHKSAVQVLFDGETDNMEEVLREEFSKRMSPYMEGEDYRLEFRMRDWSAGNLKDAIEMLQMEEGFKTRRTYVIFQVIGEEEAVRIAMKARAIFSDIFCGVITEKVDDSEKMAGLIRSHGGFGNSRVFGAGMWAVFGEDEAVGELYGLPHLMRYYGGIDRDISGKFATVLEKFNAKELLDAYRKYDDSYRRTILAQFVCALVLGLPETGGGSSIQSELLTVLAQSDEILQNEQVGFAVYEMLQSALRGLGWLEKA